MTFRSQFQKQFKQVSQKFGLFNEPGIDSFTAISNPEDLLRGGKGELFKRSLREFSVAMHRATDIVSQMATEQLQDVQVIGPDGKITNDFNEVLDLIIYSPNAPTKKKGEYEYSSGGIDAEDFWLSACKDYFVEGNMILFVDRTKIDRPYRLRLMSSASTNIASWEADGSFSYQGVEYASPPDPTTKRFTILNYHGRDVIHARYPTAPSGDGKPFRYKAQANWRRLAMNLGLMHFTNDHIRISVKESPKSKLTVTTSPGQKMDADRTKEVEDNLDDYVDNDSVLFLNFDANVTELKNPVLHAALIQFRDDLIHELSGFYGLPALLLGRNTSAYGSGIESLTRAAFKYGVKPHTRNILRALSFRLLPKGYRFVSDESKLLRGDIQSIIAMYQLLGSGQTPSVITVEEFRKLLGMVFNADLDATNFMEIVQNKVENTQESNNLTQEQTDMLREVVDILGKNK